MFQELSLCCQARIHEGRCTNCNKRIIRCIHCQKQIVKGFGPFCEDCFKLKRQ